MRESSGYVAETPRRYYSSHCSHCVASACSQLTFERRYIIPGGFHCKECIPTRYRQIFLNGQQMVSAKTFGACSLRRSAFVFENTIPNKLAIYAPRFGHSDTEINCQYKYVKHSTKHDKRAHVYNNSELWERYSLGSAASFARRESSGPTSKHHRQR